VTSVIPYKARACEAITDSVPSLIINSLLRKCRLRATQNPTLRGTSLDGSPKTSVKKIGWQTSLDAALFQLREIGGRVMAEAALLPPRLPSLLQLRSQLLPVGHSSKVVILRHSSSSIGHRYFCRWLDSAGRRPYGMFSRSTSPPGGRLDRDASRARDADVVEGTAPWRRPSGWSHWSPTRTHFSGTSTISSRRAT
jgi:hypothetical protein